MAARGESAHRDDHKAAAATSPIVSVLRSGCSAPLRTASRAKAPRPTLTNCPAMIGMKPHQQQHADQHERAAGEKHASLGFAIGLMAER